MSDDVERTARRILRAGGGRMLLALVEQGETFIPIADGPAEVALAMVCILEWCAKHPAFGEDRERIGQFLDGFNIGRIRNVRTVDLRPKGERD